MAGDAVASRGRERKREGFAIRRLAVFTILGGRSSGGVWNFNPSLSWAVFGGIKTIAASLKLVLPAASAGKCCSRMARPSAAERVIAASMMVSSANLPSLRQAK